MIATVERREGGEAGAEAAQQLPATHHHTVYLKFIIYVVAGGAGEQPRLRHINERRDAAAGQQLVLDPLKHRGAHTRSARGSLAQVVPLRPAQNCAQAGPRRAGAYTTIIC